MPCCFGSLLSLLFISDLTIRRLTAPALTPLSANPSRNLARKNPFPRLRGKVSRSDRRGKKPASTPLNGFHWHDGATQKGKRRDVACNVSKIKSAVAKPSNHTACLGGATDHSTPPPCRPPYMRCHPGYERKPAHNEFSSALLRAIYPYQCRHPGRYSWFQQ